MWLSREQGFDCVIECTGRLEGWQQSEGIRRESIRFERMQKPIYELDPATMTMMRRRYAIAEGQG